MSDKGQAVEDAIRNGNEFALPDGFNYRERFRRHPNVLLWMCDQMLHHVRASSLVFAHIVEHGRFDRCALTRVLDWVSAEPRALWLGNPDPLITCVYVLLKHNATLNMVKAFANMPSATYVRFATYVRERNATHALIRLLFGFARRVRATCLGGAGRHLLPLIARSVVLE